MNNTQALRNWYAEQGVELTIAEVQAMLDRAAAQVYKRLAAIRRTRALQTKHAASVESFERYMAKKGGCR